jgi:hypothetical protein
MHYRSEKQPLLLIGVNTFSTYFITLMVPAAKRNSCPILLAFKGKVVWFRLLIDCVFRSCLVWPMVRFDFRSWDYWVGGSDDGCIIMHKKCGDLKRFGEYVIGIVFRDGHVPQANWKHWTCQKVEQTQNFQMEREFQQFATWCRLKRYWFWIAKWLHSDMTTSRVRVSNPALQCSKKS